MRTRHFRPYDPAFSMDTRVFVLFAGGAFLALLVRRYLAARTLRKIRGPSPESWLMGEYLACL